MPQEANPGVGILRQLMGVGAMEQGAQGVQQGQDAISELLGKLGLLQPQAPGLGERLPNINDPAIQQQLQGGGLRQQLTGGAAGGGIQALLQQFLR